MLSIIKELIRRIIKDSFQMKESFLICEDTKYHKVINETTSTFSVMRVVKLKNRVFSEEVIFQDLPTFQDAKRYAESYIIAKGKEKEEGIVVLEELKQ